MFLLCIYEFVHTLKPASLILPAPPWTPGSLLALGMFWVRRVVSKREALMPQHSVYFSLSILDMPSLYPDAGISWACACVYVSVCVCACLPLSVSMSACAHAQTCVCPCAVSHATPLPRLTRYKHTTLMSLSDGNFIPTLWIPSLPSPTTPTHCQHHVHIYIGVWHRYRSESVAGDLSLSL